MNDLAISITNLGKRYKLGEGGSNHDTLIEFVSDKCCSLFRRRTSPRPARTEFWALRDVCLDIRRGENIGLIGLNGAGKSTLLKVLSRITEPSNGSAKVRGRVGALLEVGTGFHHELTGRENTYLYGSILGMSRAEIQRKFDAIVDFSGIESFIDTPVKRYSSGMYVRLAFAVAAHLEPDVLLVDEVLAVGDLPFQRKCIEFAQNLQKRDATILFVSHNMFSIKTMCDRVVYLKNGGIAFDGALDEGISHYENDCGLSTLSWVEGEKEQWPIYLTEFTMLSEDGQEARVFDHGQRIRIRMRYRAQERIQSPNFIVAFIRSDGVGCCNFCSELDALDLGIVNGEGIVELLTPPISLVSELYTAQVIVRRKGFQDAICAQIGATFHVKDPLLNIDFGVFHEKARWEMEPQGTLGRVTEDCQWLKSG